MLDSVRNIRTQLHLTQSQLAQRLGVSRSTVNRWEKGRVRPSGLGLEALNRLTRAISRPEVGTAGINDAAAKDRPAARPTGTTVSPAGLIAGQGAAQSHRTNGATASPPSEHHASNDIFRKTAVFSALDKEHLSELARLAPERCLKRGEFLFFEDDPVECCYVVASGMIKVLKHSPSGKDLITDVYGPGEILANLLLFLGMSHVTSGQAVTETRVLVIKAGDFFMFLNRHPELLFQILARMLDMSVKRHVGAVLRLSELTAERVDSRLARALFTISSKFGPTIPLTRREMAEMAGTTTETATRFVSRLQQLGVLKSFRGEVVVVKPEELRSLAQASPGT